MNYSCVNYYLHAYFQDYVFVSNWLRTGRVLPISIMLLQYALYIQKELISTPWIIIIDLFSIWTTKTRFIQFMYKGKGIYLYFLSHHISFLFIKPIHRLYCCAVFRPKIISKGPEAWQLHGMVLNTNDEAAGFIRS